MTPLEQLIRAGIAAEGPMPLDRYMSMCLGHPQHGYYTTRDPFGASGDFTTAPEISQVFGELLGIWVANCWETMGKPSDFALVELGPGRGTLMADILRVLAKWPICAEAAKVHFVEMSETLRAAQRERVPHATWHAHVASLPALPSIILANEFFDALPIRQFRRSMGRCSEIRVGLRGEALALIEIPCPDAIPLPGDGLFEDSTIRNAVATHIGDHLATLGGAALVIDYGHLRTALGDTLQAMRRQEYCSILTSPGDVDITSHVDFEALARGFQAGGAKIAGISGQGQFLSAMGIDKRIQALTSGVSEVLSNDVANAARRLVQRDQMGELFKVLCITSPELPQPYPFGAP
jgi:NADH dehydrogenase [ubiquinone] 1 alpha subcomplex assembly factor 7